jgi:hypothetical protein
MGKKIDIAALNPVVKTLKYTTFISLSRAPGHAPRVSQDGIHPRPYGQGARRDRTPARRCVDGLN